MGNERTFSGTVCYYYYLSSRETVEERTLDNY
jgi:hypothetical protein